MISGGEGQRRARPAAVETVVVGDDVVADLDTFIADEYGRTRDQFADVVLIFIAERTANNFAAVPALFTMYPYTGYTRFPVGL